MIDWHSHILPGMDDGSRDPEESLAMLSALAAQGVTLAVATPHFYANEDTVESFLARRRACLAALAPRMDAACPRLLLGAEVAYYPGVSRLEGLLSLTVEGTALLLLEMPASRWGEMTVREVLSLSAMRGVRVILAHVERCLPLQSAATVARLRQEGVLFQINASALRGFRSRRWALSKLSAGAVQLIGSDAHNMSERPPLIGEAYRVIGKKLGEPFLTGLTARGHRLLG